MTRHCWCGCGKEVRGEIEVFYTSYCRKRYEHYSVETPVEERLKRIEKKLFKEWE